MKSYLFIYLVPAVSAIIEVKLSGSTRTNFTVVTQGTDKAIITDPERIAFNVTDGVIKDCVRGYIGGRPDDAYIHSPTPWGDLYKIYGWTQTYRVLRPVTSRILNVASTPQMLKRQSFQNITHAIDISQTVYNRFAVTWLKAPYLTVNVNYNVNLDYFDMRYVNGLGQNRENVTAMKALVSLDGLDLGAVEVEMYATSVTVKTEILLRANLWGNAIVNYDRKFRGHHFYSPNLEDVMSNCGITNSLDVTGLMEVGYYADAKVVVKNKTTGLVILTRNIEVEVLT